MKQHKSCKRYVAYFDMLGFKNAVKRNQDVAWSCISEMQRSMEEMLKTKIKDLSNNIVINERVRAFIFSDSVVMYSLSNEYLDLMSILILSTKLFGQSVKYCIPLRGGISYGDFYINRKKNLFCGLPLVRAFEMGECIQWSGVRLDPIIIKHCEIYKKDNNLFFSSDIQIPWKGKLKNSASIDIYALNWPKIFKNNWTKEPPITVAEYYEAFKEMFGDFEMLEEEIQQKYINTVEFINNSLLSIETT
ncbi:MAG: hypothetical protein L3J41_04435 [Melioribacteraceae bacterium]|nr:hypothetical protein [Melioribacteraceae bacterium]